MAPPVPAKGTRSGGHPVALWCQSDRQYPAASESGAMEVRPVLRAGRPVALSTTVLDARRYAASGDGRSSMGLSNRGVPVLYGLVSTVRFKWLVAAAFEPLLGPGVCTSREPAVRFRGTCRRTSTPLSPAPPLTVSIASVRPRRGVRRLMEARYAQILVAQRAAAPHAGPFGMVFAPKPTRPAPGEPLQAASGRGGLRHTWDGTTSLAVRGGLGPLAKVA